MKKIRLIIPVLCLIIACKANENTEKKSMETSKEINNQNQSNQKTYDIVISFISMGEGIDEKTRDELVKSFKLKIDEFKTRVNVEQVPWGREGEIDYCFTLDNLTDSQKKELKKLIKQIVKDNQLINYQENVPCVHKRTN
ncbi:MAG: hypothetical protein Kow0079_12800 [Vicingaceae bacterium]